MCLAPTIARWRSKLNDLWFLGFEPPEEAAPDPLERPDLIPLEEPDEEEPLWDPLFGLEPVPCACCGAEYPIPPQEGDACPVCGWAVDSDLQTDGQPSDQNDGLCLEEARQNFRCFGHIDPSSRLE